MICNFLRRKLIPLLMLIMAFPIWAPLMYIVAFFLAEEDSCLAAHLEAYNTVLDAFRGV